MIRCFRFPMSGGSSIYFHLLRLLLVLGMPAGGNTIAAADDAGSREYQIKAAFVYNFANFVKWPKSVFPHENSPLRIGILGDDPFHGALAAITHDAKANGRPIELVHAQHIQPLLDCQILFISASESDHISADLLAVSHAPILSVSDAKNFAEAGGVIGLFVEGNKVRFSINPAAAQEHKLQMSAELLSLAHIVGKPTEPAQ